MTHLFPRTVGALASLAVVAGAVEGDVLVALTLLVIHLVALLYLDLMHFYGTARLTRHDDLGAHHLTYTSHNHRHQFTTLSVSLKLTKKRNGTNTRV